MLSLVERWQTPISDYLAPFRLMQAEEVPLSVLTPPTGFAAARHIISRTLRLIAAKQLARWRKRFSTTFILGIFHLFTLRCWNPVLEYIHFP